MAPPVLDHTHDPSARACVASANRPDTDFPIQNLPLGVFDEGGGRRIGVAIGDEVLDLASAASDGLLDTLDLPTIEALRAPALNALMALGPEPWRRVRHAVFGLLREGAPRAPAARPHLRPGHEVRPVLPAIVGDYTDFYASIDHATNVGRMLRPDQPLYPNYPWVPIGYHGRASSVVVSGTPVPRPVGQARLGQAPAPIVGPSRRLDYELELGFYVGPGNALGEPVPIAAAPERLFGVCLLNDWSARDLQAWEYQPLGPFLAKSFATSVSPWVITLDALAPFRVAARQRGEGEPAPLPYLHDEADQRTGALDLTLEAWISTRAMREAGVAPVRLSRSRARDLYWTPAQMLAHHTSNGCNLRPGDLFGSGTVSGPAPDMRGCLLELTWRGSEPVSLPLGETRRFLEDGDEVIFRGYAEAPGRARIGLGECRGVIVGPR